MNVLLTPENSRDVMPKSRAWAVDVREEKETKSKEGFCRENRFLIMTLVSCEGYLKNGALASLGLSRGSGAYYGSVWKCHVSNGFLERIARMF